MNEITQIPTRKNLDFICEEYSSLYEEYIDLRLQAHEVNDMDLWWVARSKRQEHKALCDEVKKKLACNLSIGSKLLGDWIQ